MDTEGGGWTLAWSYTFTDYDDFTDDSNAVTPRPNWPANAAVNVSISTTPTTARNRLQRHKLLSVETTWQTGTDQE